ncbi:hypothetical protein GCM10027289_09670 [Tsukamurella serpentis]
MRIIGATAAATGAAALLLGVTGADGAPASGPAPHPRPTGPELVAQAAIGVADLRPPAPSDDPSVPGARPGRHVPIAPRPEAVKVAPGPLGIPGAAYAAYKAAADRMALEAPACGIEWNLVAAIGRIESGHADGGNVDARGQTLTPIEGPVLDGSLAGNAVIRDGAGFARALGPMQFLSTTWKMFGGDNNGDGTPDVNNLRDATYGAARYLCSSSSGLQHEANQRVAVFAYNQSNSYVDNVVAWSKAYRDRAIPVGGIPDMNAPVAPPTRLPKPLPPPKVVIVRCPTDGAVTAPPAPGSPPGAPALIAPSGPAGPGGPVALPGAPSGPPAPSAVVSAPGAPGSPAATVPGSPPVPGSPSAPAPGTASSPVPATSTPPAPPAGVRGPAGAVAPSNPGPAPVTVVDCPSTPAPPSRPVPPPAPGPVPPPGPPPAPAAGAPIPAPGAPAPGTALPGAPSAARPPAPGGRPAPSQARSAPPRGPVPPVSSTPPRPPR